MTHERPAPSQRARVLLHVFVGWPMALLPTGLASVGLLRCFLGHDVALWSIWSPGVLLLVGIVHLGLDDENLIGRRSRRVMLVINVLLAVSLFVLAAGPFMRGAQTD